MSSSSPSLIDLSGDDVPDIVFGTGVDRIAPGGERYGYRDANGDGTPDLAVLYGGDDTRPPNTPRPPGYLTVISGADGAVLAVRETPDGAETYSSAVVYERADGTDWLVFGTGGETQGGAAYRAPVASLLDGTLADRVEPLVEPGSKGVIAPAVIVELTGDREPDLVISSFDGRLVAVDGATGQPLWEQRGEREETYHPPAVLRRSQNGRLGLFVSRGLGVFPKYEGSVHRLVDATNGQVLVEYENAFPPGGAPLAVDLTGDGVDEAIFFSVRFPREQSSRLHVLHLASGKLITYDLPTIFGTTPVIADPRRTGSLEMIGLAWQVRADSSATEDSDSVTVSWRNLRWQLLRLDLTAPPPEIRSWAGYMGTSTDGWYRRAEKD